jgi:hypothetical protein
VFENRVLREIFGPKRDKVKWDRRRLHKRNFMIPLLGIDGRITLKQIFKEQDWCGERGLIGLIWLRTGTGGRLS